MSRISQFFAHSLLYSACCASMIWTGSACVEASEASTASAATTETLAQNDSSGTSPVLETTVPPAFDKWAPQPRLRCSLPAVADWTVQHYHARVDPPIPPDQAVAAPQILLQQRPPGHKGLSKYSVIYQPKQGDPTDTDEWVETTASFFVGFQNSLENSGRFREIVVTTPSLSMVGPLQRFSLIYTMKEAETSQTLSGAVVAAPARRGVLIYNLALEGQPPAVLRGAMQELKSAVTRGLVRRPPVRIRTYLMWIALVVLAGLVVVVLLRLWRGTRD